MAGHEANIEHISAGEFSRDLLRPRLPLPEHNRIVEIEMRDSLGREDERRILHDFVGWRRDARSVEQIGAYRDVVSGFSRTAM